MFSLELVPVLLRPELRLSPGEGLGPALPPVYIGTVEEDEIRLSDCADFVEGLLCGSPIPCEPDPVGLGDRLVEPLFGENAPRLPADEIEGVVNNEGCDRGFKLVCEVPARFGDDGPGPAGPVVPIWPV